MKDIKTTVFSGRIPRESTIKSKIVEDCIKKELQLLGFDFHQRSVRRRYCAYPVQLGDLVPYLSPERCVRIFSDFGGGNSEDFRFAAERFIRLFQRYARETGINLLDLNAWSMHELLNDPRPEAVELRRFLENNYPSLPSLENYLEHVGALVGMAGTDLNTALRSRRPLYFRLDPTLNETDLNKIVKHLIGAVQDLFPAEETVLLIDGLPFAVAELFSDMLYSAAYRSNIFFEDVFLYPERVRNAFLNNVDKAVFFKHADPQSKRGISDFLGTNETNEVTVTQYPNTKHQFGLPRHSVFGDLSVVTKPSGRNTGYSVVKKNKPRLREDEIDALNPNEAIIVDLADRSFIISEVD